MRPIGEVRVALSTAWGEGPASVKVAAQRGCVGAAAARYTASRMVKSGELVVVKAGKPVVLALAGAVPASPVDRSTQAAKSLDLLQGVMWSSCMGGL